jgi:chromosomal replication initiation ATPase DnaA
MKAREIIRDVAKKHNLQPLDILGHDRFAHFIKARREAMVRISALGFSSSQIGAIFSRNHTSVLFQISKSHRAKKLAAMRTRKSSHQAKETA